MIVRQRASVCVCVWCGVCVCVSVFVHMSSYRYVEKICMHTYIHMSLSFRKQSRMLSSHSRSTIPDPRLRTSLILEQNIPTELPLFCDYRTYG